MLFDLGRTGFSCQPDGGPCRVNRFMLDAYSLNKNLDKLHPWWSPIWNDMSFDLPLSLFLSILMGLWSIDNWPNDGPTICRIPWNQSRRPLLGAYTLVPFIFFIKLETDLDETVHRVRAKVFPAFFSRYLPVVLNPSILTNLLLPSDKRA